MTTSKLPARPSLNSLRKQAKKLARDIVAGDAAASARARAQLPQAELPLSQRDAQLVLAREYGFPGWQDLVKGVNQRLGIGLEWAVSPARRRIHDNDIEGLQQLLATYPVLLSWTADENDGGLLGMATNSFGDSFDLSREHNRMVGTHSFSRGLSQVRQRKYAASLASTHNRKEICPSFISSIVEIVEVQNIWRNHNERLRIFVPRPRHRCIT